MEPPSEELTLRDILEILKRQKAWILTLPLLFGAVALIYGFFVAEPTYASTATLSAYRGEVPMSPKTTPNAPIISMSSFLCEGDSAWCDIMNSLALRH